MVQLIVWFLVSIVFSFLCSIWEAVLLSITPSYIRQLKSKGDSLGDTLNNFKENIDRPLSAILTLNTFAHTVGAIGVGASAGKLFGSKPFNLFGLELNGEAVVAAVMTLAILILSEIIPKTIGANNWKGLSRFTVASLKFILVALAPLVWLSELITKKLKKNKEMSVLSRQDFAAVVKEGEQSGAILESESKIIKNLFKLNRLTVRDIMTPRTVVLMASESDTVEDFFKRHKNLPFSRIPVYEKQPDELTGVVLKDEILKALAEDNHKKTLRELKNPLPVVSDSQKLDQFMESLATNNSHLSGVMDENGVLVGVVSMEDLFETILGMEIVDESDSVEDLQVLARKKWEERAKRLGISTDSEN